VWLALPFCFAAIVAPRPPVSSFRPVWSVVTALCVLALALPMYNHLDFEPFRLSLDALAHLPADRPVVALLTTDEANFNIETMLLARELKWPMYSRVNLGTVVYDITLEKTPDKSLQRLADADYVFARMQTERLAPEWTNRWAPQFKQALTASDRPVQTVDADRPISIFGPLSAK
jgi:hypothetical protein